MSKGKHSEAEMIGALKQMEAGRRAEDVGREMGVSKHTIYAWKAKYEGLDVNEAQRRRQLAGCEQQAGLSGVPGSGTGGAPKSAKAAGARGFAATGGDSGEPGMGGGFRARCDGQRAGDSRAERGGRMHAGMPDPGSGHQLCESASDAGAGDDPDRSGKTAGDSL